MYPNQYIVLVAKPGVGKGAAMRPMVGMAKTAGTVNMISDRLTVPFIFERVSKGFTAPITLANGATTVGTDHAVYIIASELPVLLGNPHELKYLSDIWDSREDDYEYGTRGGGLLIVPKPSFNLLGGVTPDGLTEAIPSASISNGFSSRIVFVYAPGKGRELPWPPDTPSDVDLVNDLREISQTVQGAFTLDPSAKPLFEKIYLESRAGDVEDEFTSHFKTRKWVHTIKTAMALSAACFSSMVINEGHLQRAYDEILEVEKGLPHVFARTGESELADLGGRVFDFIKSKGYASRGEIIHALWRHGKAEQIDSVLLMFIQTFPPILTEVHHAGKLVYKTV